MRHLAFTVKSVSFKSFDLQTPQGMRHCSTSVTAGHSWSQLDHIIFIPNAARDPHGPRTMIVKLYGCSQARKSLYGHSTCTVRTRTCGSVRCSRMHRTDPYMHRTETRNPVENPDTTRLHVTRTSQEVQFRAGIPRITRTYGFPSRTGP